MPLDLQLIHHSVDIVVGLGNHLLLPHEHTGQLAGQGLGVHQLDIEVFLIPVFALEQEAITEPMAEGFIALVEVAGGQALQLVQNGRDLPLGNALGLILARQKLTQVINNQHLTVILAGHIATDIVGVAGLIS